MHDFVYIVRLQAMASVLECKLDDLGFSFVARQIYMKAVIEMAEEGWVYCVRVVC